MSDHLIIAVQWTVLLNALACTIQSLEYLRLQRYMTEDAIWKWSLLQNDYRVFSRPVQKLLEILLQNPKPLLFIRLFASVMIFIQPHWIFFAIIFVSTLLIAIRFRGTFNGGSDFMTLIINACLCIAFIFADSPSIQKACLFYVGVQSIFSYFIAGYIKIKRPKWRNGLALIGFLNNTIFGNKISVSKQPLIQKITFILSWGTMLFELAFPLCFFNFTAALVLTSIAASFHVINFYIFGLNRFVFAWISTYPAIYLIALNHSSAAL